MNRIIYLFAYSFLWTITWLPLRVLFLVSDFFYVIVYYLIGYRKKVVRKNLRNSFPEKSESELRKIEKEFYHHFCDSFVEWMYPLHRDAKAMEKYYRFTNPEVLDELFAEGIGVVGVLGHYGNWEFLSTLPVHIKHKVWAIHKPLSNPHFNGLINRLRSKYGVHMMDTKTSFRTLLSEAKAGETTLTYFLADQSPQKSKIKYWTTFLNQDTPVFLGAEQIATKLNNAVVFIDIRKVKRGKYTVTFEVLAKDPKACEPNEITELHVRALENVINEEPAYWLWSHRRWKHKKEE